MGPVAAIDAPHDWPDVGTDPSGRSPPQRRQPARRRRRRRRGRRRPALDRTAVPAVNLEIVEPGPERTPSRCACTSAAPASPRPAAPARAPAHGPRRSGASSPPTREITVHMDGGDAKVRLDQPQRARHPGRSGHVRRIGPGRVLSAVRQGPVDAIQRSTRRNADRAHQPGADRAGRRHVPPGRDDDTDASLDELALLIDTAGADDAATVGAAARPARPHLVHRQGQGRRVAGHVPRRSTPTRSCSTTSSPRRSSTTWRRCSAEPRSTAPR